MPCIIPRKTLANLDIGYFGLENLTLSIHELHSLDLYPLHRSHQHYHLATPYQALPVHAALLHLRLLD